MITQAKNYNKFKNILCCNGKILYNNIEYIISKDNNLIPKKLSESCKKQGTDKKVNFLDKINQLNKELINNKLYFINELNLNDIIEIKILIPKCKIERVNGILEITGYDKNNNYFNKNYNLYIKDIIKSPEVNILSPEKFLKSGNLKRTKNNFIDNLHIFSEEYFSLNPKNCKEIFGNPINIENQLNYISKNCKKIIKSIIPYSDFIIDYNCEKLSIMNVNKIVNAYNYLSKKEDSFKDNLIIGNQGIKIIQDLFYISRKGSGSKPQYFKICINKSVFEKLNLIINDIKFKKSESGSNAVNSGKEFEEKLVRELNFNSGEQINELTNDVINQLNIEKAKVYKIETTALKGLKPDISTKIIFKDHSEKVINFSAKSQKSNIGHLSGHTKKSFYENMYKIKNMADKEKDVFDKLFKYKYVENLKEKEKKIISNYFSNILKEVFDYIFNYGNNNIKADFIILNDKRKIKKLEVSKIYIIDQNSIFNFYIENNLTEFRFHKKQIFFMNDLFSLEIRSNGFQYHLFKNKLIKNIDK